MMPLHSLLSLANPREARVSRASSPVSVARTWAQHPRAQGDPSSSVLRDLAVSCATPGRALRPQLAISGTRPPGTSVPGSSREERGRPDWSQTDGRGRPEKPHRSLGYPSRLGYRIVGNAVDGVNVLHHLGRPIAELGRDATQVIDQVRRLEARERAEPKRAPPNRAVAQVLSSQTSGSAEVAEPRDEQVDAGGSGHDHDQDPSMVCHPSVELLGQ